MEAKKSPTIPHILAETSGGTNEILVGVDIVVDFLASM